MAISENSEVPTGNLGTFWIPNWFPNWQFRFRKIPNDQWALKLVTWLSENSEFPSGSQTGHLHFRKVWGTQKLINPIIPTCHQHTVIPNINSEKKIFFFYKMAALNNVTLLSYTARFYSPSRRVLVCVTSLSWSWLYPVHQFIPQCIVLNLLVYFSGPLVPFRFCPAL